jgi:hypothetical protein
VGKGVLAGRAALVTGPRRGSVRRSCAPIPEFHPDRFSLILASSSITRSSLAVDGGWTAR